LVTMLALAFMVGAPWLDDAVSYYLPDQGRDCF